MVVASACLLVLIGWTLLAYSTIPLPLSDAFYGWLRRQWLSEGIAALTCLGVFGVAVNAWRSRHDPCPPWWMPWLVWIGWAGLSVIWSIDRGVTLRTWMVFVSYGLLAAVMGSVANSERQVKLWARCLVGVAAIAGIKGLLQYFGTLDETLPVFERLHDVHQLELRGWSSEVIRDFLVRKRIFSVFGWPNLFAGFLVLMIPVAVALAVEARSAVGRIGWGGCGALLMTCLVLTLSMGGWFAAIVTACLGWWLLRRQPEGAGGVRATERRRLARVVSVAVIVCVLLSAMSFIVAKRSRSLIVGSVSSRVVYVQGASHILKLRPVTGTGFGTFGIAYHALKPDEPTEGQHTALHAHNTLLELGADLGILGIVAFAIFLWPLGRLIDLATRPPPSAARRALPMGLAIGVLGFFVYGLLEQVFFEAVTAPFWWLLVGLLSAAVADAHPAARRTRARPTGVVLAGASVALACAAGLLAVRFAIADAHGAQAALLHDAGKKEAAFRAFHEAQQWDPLASRFPFESGQRLVEELDRAAHAADDEQWVSLLTRARGQFERTVELSPWHGPAWLRLGLVRWQLGEQQLALQAVRHAVHRDPNSRAALVHLAQMLSALGPVSELRDLADRFRRLEPNSPLGLLWDALAWEGQGNVEAAVEAYRRLLTRFPDFRPASTRLAHLEQQQDDARSTR